MKMESDQIVEFALFICYDVKWKKKCKFVNFKKSLLKNGNHLQSYFVFFCPITEIAIFM